jgi:hypothetical protein
MQQPLQHFRFVPDSEVAVLPHPGRLPASVRQGALI